MTRRLAREWIALGHRVTVLTCRWDRAWAERESVDGSEVVRLSVWRVRFLGTLRYVGQSRRWLDSHARSFDVIYVSMLKHAAYACLTAQRNQETPIVLRAEGAGATGDMSWQQTARFGQRIRATCHRADAVVAPSEAIERELLEAGYSSERIHRIANGAPIPEVPWTAGAAAASRRELGLSERPTLCYTGRLHREKGLCDLIDALPRIIAENGPVTLLLVGDGPQRTELAARARDTGLADHVVFTGQVDDVDQYLRASDLFVLPSYLEGLSVSLLEALALGIPALASDIAPNHGILPPNHLPLVPIRDPAALASAIVRQLDAGAADATALADVRRSIADRFGIHAIAESHLRLFESLREDPKRKEGWE